MASLTTSYFAVSKNKPGTKISIARWNPPKITGKIEIQTSFAPSAELLRSYKDGKRSWFQYTQRYTAEQRTHFRENPEHFEDLLKRATIEDIILLCYERYDGPETQCHRFLLYDMLQKIANEWKYDVRFVDETPPHK